MDLETNRYELDFWIQMTLICVKIVKTQFRKFDPKAILIIY